MPLKPSRGALEARKSDYELQVSRFRKEAQIDQDFIDATLEWRARILDAYIAGFPRGFVQKAIPYAQMAIESAKNTVMAGEIPEVKESLQLEEGKEASDAQEKKRKTTELFDKAFLTEIAMRSSSNPFSELYRQQFGIGGGVLGFMWDEAIWAERDEETPDVFPWRVSVSHLLKITPDPYNDPPKDYFLEDEISANDAAERYPSFKKWGHELPPTGKVKRWSYCSEQWYAVYIDGEPVYDGDVVENPMGCLWYELALSGLGHQQPDGNVVSLWQGRVRSLRDIIAMMVTNLNLREATKFQESFSGIHVSAQTEDEADAAGRRVTNAPMEIWATSSDVKIEPMRSAPVHTISEAEQAEVDRWAQILMGPLSGEFQSNETTASGLAQRINLQTAPYQAAKVSAEQAIANMLRKVKRFYSTHVEGEFSLRVSMGKRVTFNAQDLLTDSLVEVDLKPVTAADRALNKDSDLKDLEMKAISLREYQRRQGITDGQKMDKEIAVEILKWHPLIIDAAAQAVALQVNPQQGLAGAQPAHNPAGGAFQAQPATQGSMMGGLARAMVPGQVA